MGRIKLAFQFASVSEMKRFEILVSDAIERTGLNALELTENFDDFLRYKDPRGTLCQDFMEFMAMNGVHYELEMAA